MLFRSEDIAGKGAKQLSFNQIPLDSAGPYAAEDADITLRLHAALWPRVEAEQGLRSVFEDIDDVAVEQDANLVIMGTHGLRGMQFLTGGRALRIVTNCSTPFIITQERGIKESGYDDIVVPLDLHQDTKQKLSTVAEMASYFNGRVHIISPAETDEFLQNQLKRNIEFAKEYFSERKIEYTVKISDHSSSAFVKDVVRYAASIEADLISIMNLHEKSLMGILGQSYEQQIITNEAQIPVLIINPIETRVIRGSEIGRAHV